MVKLAITSLNMNRNANNGIEVSLSAIPMGNHLGAVENLMQINEDIYILTETEYKNMLVLSAILSE